MTTAEAALGAALRRAGLTPKALAAAWGTSTIARLPRAFRPLPATPTTAALRLLVAGEPVAVTDAERGLGPALAALRDRALVELDDTPGRLRARVHIVPVGPSLVAYEPDCWPDDSSHHLLECLPGARAARWLDVGTGCAIAPLARPDRATAIVAGELDPRAAALAALGVALSGARHVAVIEADLTAGTGDGFDLVTFNLPIPAEAGLTHPTETSFRHAPPGADLLARFVREIPARITAGATIVLHTWLGPPAAAIVDGLPGEVTVVRYTPDDAAAFGVVQWRPDRPAARGRGRRLPTADAPHLCRDDLDAAAPH